MKFDCALQDNDDLFIALGSVIIITLTLVNFSFFRKLVSFGKELHRIVLKFMFAINFVKYKLRKSKKNRNLKKFNQTELMENGIDKREKKIFDK